jgi:hypothetical protein
LITTANATDPVALHFDKVSTVATVELDPVFLAWLLATPPAYLSNLTDYVPYTGATANVDLGNYNLTGYQTGFNNGALQLYAQIAQEVPKCQPIQFPIGFDNKTQQPINVNLIAIECLNLTKTT